MGSRRTPPVFFHEGVKRFVGDFLGDFDGGPTTDWARFAPEGDDSAESERPAASAPAQRRRSLKAWALGAVV